MPKDSIFSVYLPKRSQTDHLSFLLLILITVAARSFLSTADKLEDWIAADKISISKFYVKKLTPTICPFMMMSLKFVKDHSHNFNNSDIDSGNNSLTNYSTS